MIRPYSIEWGLSIYFYLPHPNPTNNMNMKSHTNNMGGERDENKR